MRATEFAYDGCFVSGKGLTLSKSVRIDKLLLDIQTNCFLPLLVLFHATVGLFYSVLFCSILFYVRVSEGTAAHHGQEVS